MAAVLMAQQSATVAWFNNANGRGFLKAEGAPDVFCHFTLIQGDGFRSLKESEPVECDVEQASRGLKRGT